ncbi:hypothetical protein C8Q78DRAFT_492121 [Trametes maxima]|nr:hypothetical protein C8Q78DRAFT_492121 [Trametes maxima]
MPRAALVAHGSPALSSPDRHLDSVSYRRCAGGDWLQCAMTNVGQPHLAVLMDRGPCPRLSSAWSCLVLDQKTYQATDAGAKHTGDTGKLLLWRSTRTWARACSGGHIVITRRMSFPIPPMLKSDPLAVRALISARSLCLGHADPRNIWQGPPHAGHPDRAGRFCLHFRQQRGVRRGFAIPGVCTRPRQSVARIRKKLQLFIAFHTQAPAA